MTHFEVAIDIQAPPDRVWAVMSDVERWREWTASISRIEKLDPGPLRVGTRARVYQPKLLPALWEVTEVRDRSFTWISRSPGVLATAVHSVEPTSAGSRAILELTFSGWLSSLIGRLMGGITHRYMAMEAAGLKQRSEQALTQTA